MVCVADIDKSLGRRGKREMVALICKVASGERERQRRREREEREKHADNWDLKLKHLRGFVVKLYFNTPI